jgi:hypothetical protein
MFPVHLQRPAQNLERYVQFYTQRELRLLDPLFVQSVPARAAPMLEFVFGDSSISVIPDPQWKKRARKQS